MPYGDFSTNPFQYRERVSRVLYQMGRVQLDSDANEQTESTLRFLRGLGTDVIGLHGGLDGAFEIRAQADARPFTVGYGHYYVDGIRCVNMPFEHPWEIVGATEKATKENGEKYKRGRLATAEAEPFWNLDLEPKEAQIVYLAVWERHISAAEYDDFREVALLGPETTTRAVVTWQIRSMPVTEYDKLVKQLTAWLALFDPKNPNDPKWDINYLALNLLLRSGARLKAKAKENQDLEACVISPEARYRGTDNRLYRVEIHQSDPRSFKWSPDNAAIVYPIREIAGTTITLDSLGRDERTALRVNDWVEVVDDRITLLSQTNALRQVVKINRQRMEVELDASPENDAGEGGHPILRRWADDVQPFNENQWIELSDGVQVMFSKVDSPHARYRPGDYWLIPARTATGGVIWPGGTDTPVAPHGVNVHYAPLARWTPGTTSAVLKDLRQRFQSLAIAVP